MTIKWEPHPPGQCVHPGCMMTLLASIGGGAKMCWLHWFVFGLPIDREVDVETLRR
jgi:hypothetical protein